MTAPLRIAAAPVPTGPIDILTEDGNADALITRWGHNIRFVRETGRWLVWNELQWKTQGPRPVGGDVREMVKHVARQIGGAPAAERWRGKSLSAIGTTNTLTQASSDPRITVSISELDADPWALNTPGGVVDLRTGELRPGRPADMHTRLTTATPDSSADAGPWLRFLKTTFGGDAELVGYLQRLVGYSATGHIGPHVLPFAYGTGGNGKGVFLESITKVLGDYATTAPNGFLMAQTYRQHETEIARLAGARMVLCSEVDEEDRFDEQKVKLLTGGDTLTAKFMRQDHVTFTPSHHLWLMGNHQPVVRSGGRSFWRRCRLIPFRHQVDKADEVDDLQGILAREQGGAILAWIVQGAVDYYNDGRSGGLAEPGSVIDATAAYAKDQDTVGRFVAERCHLAEGSTVVKMKIAAMRSAYEQWCTDAGDEPVSAKRFGTDLAERFGVTGTRASGARFYVGICLQEEPKNED